MARVFTRKEVDAMIEAAVAKVTAPLLEWIAALEAELAKAKKNSSNSSKPPSSDLVKPPKPPRVFTISNGPAYSMANLHPGQDAVRACSSVP